MTDASGATAGAIAHAMIANAIKACGTIIRVDPKEFHRIIEKQNNPLIVRAKGGIFSTHYKYLTSYKGMAFYCKTEEKIRITQECEFINAEKIAIPDL